MRDDVISGSSQNGCLLVASSTELHGTTPGFEDFGETYRTALRQRIRVLVAKAPADEALIEQRTELFVTWFLGLDVAVRGAASEAEIDRIIDAMRTTIETWRNQTTTPPAHHEPT